MGIKTPFKEIAQPTKSIKKRRKKLESILKDHVYKERVMEKNGKIREEIQRRITRYPREKILKKTLELFNENKDPAPHSAEIRDVKEKLKRALFLEKNELDRRIQIRNETNDFI